MDNFQLFLLEKKQDNTYNKELITLFYQDKKDIVFNHGKAQKILKRLQNLSYYDLEQESVEKEINSLWKDFLKLLNPQDYIKIKKTFFENNTIINEDWIREKKENSLLDDSFFLNKIIITTNEDEEDQYWWYEDNSFKKIIFGENRQIITNIKLQNSNFVSYEYSTENKKWERKIESNVDTSYLLDLSNNIKTDIATKLVIKNNYLKWDKTFHFAFLYNDTETIVNDDNIQNIFTETIEIIDLVKKINDFYGFKTKQTLIKKANILRYNYSYNESITFHKNDQKDFSFYMEKENIIENSIQSNPFIEKIQIGSLLLFIDYYGNNFLFRVKQIDLNYKLKTIEYKYTCQDNFSFIYNSHKRGYYIKNDITSNDFIGDKDIDYWIKKIKDDCDIIYNYIETSKSLEVTDNETTTVGDNETIYIRNNNLQQIYNDNYKSYNIKEKKSDILDSFIFSIENSTPSEAIFSAVEKIKYNLKTFEFITEQGELILYFWVEPEKNQTRIINLKKKNTKNLSLKSNNNNFSSLMYVKNNEINNEQISMIDNIPYFFLTYMSSENWKEWSERENSIWQLKIKEEDMTEEDIDDLQIKINSRTLINFKDISSGEKIILKYDKNKDTISNIASFDDDTVNYFWTIPGYNSNATQSQSNIINFYFKKDWKSKRSYYTRVKILINIDGSPQKQFDYDYYDQKASDDNNGYDKFEILLTEGAGYNWTNTKEILFDITLYTPLSQEELNFVEICDKIPWIENCLIDLSYFLYNNLITQEKYQEILNNFYYDLKNINLNLLYYSSAYTQILKDNIEKKSFLINLLDKTYAEVKRAIDKQENENFFIELKDIFLAEIENNSILEYDKWLKENIILFFNAEQRFLKNLYYFLKFYINVYYPEKQLNGSESQLLYTYNIKLQEYWDIMYNSSQLINFWVPKDWKNWISIEKAKTFIEKFSKEETLLKSLIIDSNNKAYKIEFENGSYWSFRNFNDSSNNKEMNIEDGIKKDFYFLTSPDEYSNEKLYQAGDYVKKDNIIYICKTAITRIEDFNPEKWIHIIDTWSSKTNNLFLGYYPELIDILLTNYTEKNSFLYEKYNYFKQRQQDFWAYMYKIYPEYLISSTYEDKNATTSIDLFHSAENEFKNRSYPELQFNFSYIEDLNYNYSEKKVGDILKIDKNDFDIKDALIYDQLQQFLYITDIQLTLRTKEYKITVNSIKHQEKAWKEIIKLIK